MKKTKQFLLSVSLCVCLFKMSAQISAIRWGTTTDPLTNLEVTWSNLAGTADSIKWGYTSSLEKGSSLGVKRTGYTGYFFKHTFATVTPTATIFYKLYDSKGKAWSSVYQFKTASDPSLNKFTFTAVGDSRDGMAAWTSVSTESNSKYKTDFIVFSGDLIDDDSQNSEWDAWFSAGATFLQNNMVIHAQGNHETADTPNYLNCFSFPTVNSQNLYYDVTFANTIFITLNSEDTANVTQYTWLKTTLAAAQANPNIMWKVINFHRPFFTVGPHAGEMDVELTKWWKAFDDYGVDLVLNGHDHMYERSKPINRNVSTTAPVANYGSGPTEGRCEIVSGGAGAPFYTGTADAFTQNIVMNTNHFCKLNVTPLANGGSILCDSTFDINGNLIDNFCISKAANATGVKLKNTVFNPISVYPNPTDGNITLSYSSALRGTAIIKIFDVTGKEVFSDKPQQKNADKMELKYNLAGYAKGFYSIQVVMGEQKDNAIFIVK
jgi:predicted MPP superfamily phosphohydrolase